MQIQILFALRRESMFFRRGLRLSKLAAPCPAWTTQIHGLTLQVLETGVGQKRMAAVLDWAAGQRPTDLMVMAGFGGALSADLGVGAVVVATEVVDATGPVGRVDPHFLDVLPHHCPRGRLLTVDRLVTTPREKHRLAQVHEAVAVDMETASLVRHCVRHGIGWLAMRAISDEMGTGLSPQLVRLLSGGRVSAWRLGWQLLRRPALVGELWRLGRATRRASLRLAEAIHSLLREIHRLPTASGRETAERLASG